MGRFLSTDPIGYQDQLNLYAYVGNDPVNKTDPTGEKKYDIDAVAKEMRQNVEQANRNAEAFSEARSEAMNDIMDEAPIIGEAKSLVDIANDPSLETIGLAAAGMVPGGKQVAKRASSITKSSLKRLKRLIVKRSKPEAMQAPLNQRQVDKMRKMVEKAGGNLRNDGTSGTRGTSAGVPHVQTEGLGNCSDSRHIWTEDDVY